MVFSALLNLATGTEENAALPVVVMFGIIQFIEKLFTVYHAKHYVKEYIPLEKETQPLRK